MVRHVIRYGDTMARKWSVTRISAIEMPRVFYVDKRKRAAARQQRPWIRILVADRQCKSDQILRFKAYIRPVSTSRNSITLTPRRLRASSSGSAAQAKNVTTSLDIC